MSSVIDPFRTELKRVLIVGRPNVGKSTLFNQLARTRDAIVADVPGVTVDLHAHVVCESGRAFVLVDSGGFEPATKSSDALVRGRNARVEQMIVEAEGILFVVDIREGLTDQEQAFFRQIMKQKKAGTFVWIIANKADDPERTYSGESELFRLGRDVERVSSEHRQGIDGLRTRLMEALGRGWDESTTKDAEVKHTLSDRPIRIAFIGRPNVGKSTWCNRLLGEERSVVTALPGTTRDVLRYPFQWNGRSFEIFDTAGVRRAGRQERVVERHTATKAMRALEDVDVAVLVIDALEGMTEMDAHLASEAWTRGAGLIVAVNKWDEARKDIDFKKFVSQYIYKLSYFGDVAQAIPVSGKTGIGQEKLLRAIVETAEKRFVKIPTSRLNRSLTAWTHESPHRRTPRGNAVTFHYLIHTAQAPQRFLIHSNRPKDVDKKYLRYLEKRLRDDFDLGANPIYFAVLERS